MKNLFDIAKLIRIGIVAVGCLGAWAAVKFKYESQGVAKERVRVEKKATENAAKADAARRSVERIPDERLRDRYCRDCR
jgi:Pyruvate/2-oxoacid:ferredoxin oxidoreductase gamma subunit